MCARIYDHCVICGHCYELGINPHLTCFDELFALYEDVQATPISVPNKGMMLGDMLKVEASFVVDVFLNNSVSDVDPKISTSTCLPTCLCS